MNKPPYTFETWEKAFSAISEQEQKYAICKDVLHNLNSNKVYPDPKLSLTKFCSIVGTAITPTR